MQLEILDLSRNLITELPAADFGSLMSLKVLYRLPSISKMFVGAELIQ